MNCRTLLICSILLGLPLQALALGARKCSALMLLPTSLENLLRVRRSQKWGTLENVYASVDKLMEAEDLPEPIPPERPEVRPAMTLSYIALRSTSQIEFAVWSSRAEASHKEVSEDLLEVKNPVVFAGTLTVVGPWDSSQKRMEVQLLQISDWNPWLQLAEADRSHRRYIPTLINFLARQKHLHLSDSAEVHVRWKGVTRRQKYQTFSLQEFKTFFPGQIAN